MLCPTEQAPIASEEGGKTHCYRSRCEELPFPFTAFCAGPAITMKMLSRRTGLQLRSNRGKRDKSETRVCASIDAGLLAGSSPALLIPRENLAKGS